LQHCREVLEQPGNQTFNSPRVLLQHTFLPGVFPVHPPFNSPRVLLQRNGCVEAG